MNNSTTSPEQRLLPTGTGGGTVDSSHEGFYSSPNNPGFGNGFRVSTLSPAEQWVDQPSYSTQALTPSWSPLLPIRVALFCRGLLDVLRQAADLQA